MSLRTMPRGRERISKWDSLAERRSEWSMGVPGPRASARGGAGPAGPTRGPGAALGGRGRRGRRRCRGRGYACPPSRRRSGWGRWGRRENPDLMRNAISQVRSHFPRICIIYYFSFDKGKAKWEEVLGGTQTASLSSQNDFKPHSGPFVSYIL